MKAIPCPQFDPQQELYVLCPAYRQSSEPSKSQPDLGFIGGIILTLLVWAVVGALLDASDRREQYKQSTFNPQETTVVVPSRLRQVLHV
jgi:hypothetical protein